MAIQDILKQMNESPPDLDKPPAGGTPPATPPTDQTPPAEPPKDPVTPPAQPKAPEAPIDPKTPAATQPPNNTATPTEPKPGETPAPPATEDVPDPVFYGRLSKLTDNAIKSEEDFVGFINHYNELLEEKEQGFQPKFKYERAKLAYQILTENAGREPEAAMRTLRAISFNPEGKSPKEVLFEAYLIDPNNSDLSPSKAQEYFEAEYNDKYGDLEGNLVKERALAKEVKDATKLISDVSNSFKAVEEQPKQISEQVEKSITNAVDGFGGIKMAFTDNPQESDFLNMAVEDQRELAELKQDILNPQEWYNNFLQQFATEKGFDYPALAREMYEMKNHAKKAQLAFDHGRKVERLAIINENRNASDPKNISEVGSAGAVTPAGPKSVGEAWGKAVGVA